MNLIIIGEPNNFIHPFLEPKTSDCEIRQSFDFNAELPISNILIDNEPATREKLIELLIESFGENAVRDLVISIEQLANVQKLEPFEKLIHELNYLENHLIKYQNYENTNRSTNSRFYNNEGKCLKARSKSRNLSNSNYFKFVHHKCPRQEGGGKG